MPKQKSDDEGVEEERQSRKKLSEEATMGRGPIRSFGDIPKLFDDEEDEEQDDLIEEQHEPEVGKEPASLEELQQEIADVLRPMRERFQQTLRTLEGTSKETLEENQHLAAVLNETAQRLRVLFRCNKEDCGCPAKLRCKPMKGMKAGSFVFEHHERGFRPKLVYHGAGSSIPALTICEATEG